MSNTFFSDENGQLIRPHDGYLLPLSSERHCMPQLYPGEPRFYWLLAKDKSFAVRTMIVPYPIEISADDGAKISLVADNHNFDSYVCFGTGFKNDEEIDLFFHVGEMLYTCSQKCVEGKFIHLIDLMQFGKGGKAQFAVERKTGEALVIEYEWGNVATKKGKRVGPFSNFTLEDFYKMIKSQDARPETEHGK